MIVRVSLVLCFSVSLLSARPSETNSTTTSTSTTTTATTTTTQPDYFEKRVNEVASVSCDICLKAVYGINYNVIRLKKAAEDMVKLDCEALFHDQAEDIANCIRVMVEKIEEYYDKVEPVIDTRNVCIKMRMCAPLNQVSKQEKKKDDQ